MDPQILVLNIFFFPLILRMNFIEKIKLWLEHEITKHFKAIPEEQIVSWV